MRERESANAANNPYAAGLVSPSGTTGTTFYYLLPFIEQGTTYNLANGDFHESAGGFHRDQAVPLS